MPPLPISETGGVMWRWSKVGCVHARPLQCIHAAMGPTNSSNRRHFHGRSARPVPSRFRADREGSAGQGWYCDGTGMAVRRNRNRTATEPKRPCDGTPFPPHHLLSPRSPIYAPSPLRMILCLRYLGFRSPTPPRGPGPPSCSRIGSSRSPAQHHKTDPNTLVPDLGCHMFIDFALFCTSYHRF